MSHTETTSDHEMLQKLAAQIAVENPCATREEIMDLVAAAVKERMDVESEFSGNTITVETEKSHG